MLIPIHLNDKVRNYGTTGRGVSARENIIIKTTKAIHLLFATAWAGGAFSMQALSYLRLTGDLDAATCAVIAMTVHHIDTFVVMPGLAGCILTGLFYSICTSIGFIRYFWIGYKWVISCCAAFWGTIFWCPAGNNLIDSCLQNGWPFAADLLAFIRSCLLPESFWQAVMQTVLIFSMLIISVYRPLTWRHLLRRVSNNGHGKKHGTAITLE